MQGSGKGDKREMRKHYTKEQRQNGSLNCHPLGLQQFHSFLSFKQKVLFIIIDANNKSGMQTVTV